jgi:hypothetical protein
MNHIALTLSPRCVAIAASAITATSITAVHAATTIGYGSRFLGSVTIVGIPPSSDMRFAYGDPHSGS